MNFSDNMGIALRSNDMSGIGAAATRQSLSGAGTTAPDGTLFQQMMGRMMAEKSLASETTAASGNGLTGSSAGIGRMLSGFISGGTLAELRTLSTGDAIVEGKGNSGETDVAADNEALEALQALMGSITNAFPASNIVGILQETRDGNSQPVPAKQLPISATVTELGETGLLSGSKINAANGMLAYSGAIQTDGDFFAGNGTITGTMESEPISAAGSLTIDKNLNPDEEMTVTASGMTEETIPGEKQTFGTMEDNTGKQMRESDTDGFSLNELAYRSTVQGAAPTAEPDAQIQTTQPAASDGAYVQIRDEILAKLDQKGPSEFQMQLKPEDLGQIDIKLRLSDGKLIIDILAASSKTQALLTSQVDKLISGMGLQNVQVESVQVNQQMNGQMQDNSQNQSHAMQAAMDFSQRKQQEQFRNQSGGNGNRNGVFGLTAEQTDPSADPVGSVRYENQRMNYKI